MALFYFAPMEFTFRKPHSHSRFTAEMTWDEWRELPRLSGRCVLPDGREGYPLDDDPDLELVESEHTVLSNAYNRGLTSFSEGCHSSQVEHFRNEAKKIGCTGVEITNDGTVKFSTRRQRAKWLKHRHMHDRDGGYGDG